MIAELSLIFLALKFNEVAPLISALFSGGLLTALVLWRKAGAEKNGIVAVASRQAIEVFESSIHQLKDDLTEAIHEVSKLREELTAARLQVGELVTAKQDLEAEVRVLRRRVIELDQLVTSYEDHYGTMTRPAAGE